MNEKRQSFNKYKEGKTDLESSMENLIALLSSLESSAKLCGSFIIARQIEQLKRAAIKNNGNKKILKSIRAKYETYKQQVQELEYAKKQRIK